MLTRQNRFALRWAFVTAALLCFFVLLGFTGAAQARITPRSAFSDLNTMRGEAGLPRISSLRSRWNRGCQLHNRYMRRTGSFGHAELPTSKYYTKLGALAAARSVISQPSSLPSRAFGDTIYHRMAVLQPRLRSIGFSGADGYTCLQVIGGVSNKSSARSGRAVVSPWPANGATGLDPSFNDSEWPDPLNDAPGATQLGTPITFSVNGPWKRWQAAASHVTSASLVSELGKVVPVAASDAGSANAVYLQGGIAILPRQFLPENTWFTATVTGSVSSGGRSWPFSVSTRFRTGVDR